MKEPRISGPFPPINKCIFTALSSPKKPPTSTPYRKINRLAGGEEADDKVQCTNMHWCAQHDSNPGYTYVRASQRQGTRAVAA